MSQRPESPESDAAIVARMARGDRSALGALYERHAPRLLGLSLRILGDRSEAEDLVHDVFLEAWKHAADYSAERGTVSSWLGLRTRSRAIDRRRAAPRSRAADLTDALLRELSDPEADPARTAFHGKLRRAFDGISREEQQVILLGYFEGLSSSEIAERVNLPLGTVKSRTRNALGKLRAWFASQGGDP